MSTVYVKMSEHYTATVTEESLPSLKDVVKQHIKTVKFRDHLHTCDGSPESKQLLDKVFKIVVLEKFKWAKEQLVVLHKAERRSTQLELGGFVFPRQRTIQMDGETVDTWSHKNLKDAIEHALLTRSNLEVVGGFDWGATMHPNDRQPLAGEYFLVVVEG